MFVFLFVVLFINKLILCENVCFDNDIAETHLHLGTKTAYRILENSDTNPPMYSGCHPNRIWSTIRHGTRMPNKNVIKSIQTRLIYIRNQIIGNPELPICAESLDLFRRWKVNFHEDEPSYLTTEGHDELLRLAERMQKRFPDVLPDLYENGTYKFKFTETQRAQKSYEAFATGLFGQNNIAGVKYEAPVKKDPIIRFYKSCDKWRKDVKKNPQSLYEVRQWEKREEIQNILREIRLATSVVDLSFTDLHLIYTTCAFETAHEQIFTSPWCTLFNKHSIQAMEFMEDLKYYYLDGYGMDITSQQACVIVRDMYEHIKPNSTEPQATFYFTHSGAILKVLSHLGLYKDNFVLTHKDFNKNRKWQTSKIDSFGSNIAFVLYSCDNTPYILFTHQERPVRLPGCPSDNDLCSLDTFYNNYKDSIDNCNFSELCSLSKTKDEL